MALGAAGSGRVYRLADSSRLGGPAPLIRGVGLRMARIAKRVGATASTASPHCKTELFGSNHIRRVGRTRRIEASRAGCASTDII